MSVMMPYPQGQMTMPYPPQYGATAGSISYTFLNSLREAIAGEDRAAAYYTELAERVQDPEQKKYIAGFAADERDHGQAFRTLYYQLTGQVVPPTSVNVVIPADLQTAYADRVKAEVGDFLEYRDMMLSTNNQYIRDIFFEAMTDEASHAQLFQLFLEMA